jgi:hypothetical protein
MNQSYLSKALTAIRLILGIIFLVSGVGKLISGSEARYLVELLATEYYWLIEYAHFIVITTSIIEILLAVFLLWNKFLKWALTGSLALLIGFSSVLSYFYFQGMSVENCGCFGAFGFASGLEFTLLRNLILIALILGAYLILTSESYRSEEITA